MATRKPTDTPHTDPLPGEDEMARVYRAAAQDAPPASPDARILAEAKPKARGPFGGRWAFPLSTAAVIVLSLGVLMLLSEPGVLTNRDASVPMGVAALPETPSRSAAPASPAPPAADTANRTLRDTAAPAKTKRAAPEPAARLAESAESKLVKQAPAEMMKKAEAPPVAAQLDALKRAIDADLAREEKARARSTPGGVATMSAPVASAIGIRVSGPPGAYQFSVTIQSPDAGCMQYADWWEVVSADGKLLYRRVLMHSHVDEQPFTRSGGPVPIQSDTVVWVRAHMNHGGYGGAALKGSVKTGFKLDMHDDGFAASLAKQAPLPDGCDF